jgi:hypothetical protein
MEIRGRDVDPVAHQWLTINCSRHRQSGATAEDIREEALAHRQGVYDDQERGIEALGE